MKLKYLILDIFKLLNLESRLFSLEIISSKSADFDGCIKLINKRKINITLFDIPEIKINKLKD